MSNTICLKNAHIFTGTMMIPEGAVIIENDKIIDVVGKERLEKLNLPGDTRYIDIKGSNLCAGFIDTHIHGFGGYDTSDATYENMLEGMQAGILHATHFFNAMRKLHHRDPGCVGAILIHPEISCEIIADGHHVHPALIKLLYRDKPVDKIVLVTDALGPTMQKEGILMANKEEVFVENDVFIKKKDKVIAGSSLTMLKGIKNLVSWGIPLEDAILMATANPARVLGIDRETGLLIPGHRADITTFDNNYQTTLTMASGKILYDKL